MGQPSKNHQLLCSSRFGFPLASGQVIGLLFASSQTLALRSAPLLATSLLSASSYPFGSSQFSTPGRDAIPAAFLFVSLILVSREWCICRSSGGSRRYMKLKFAHGVDGWQVDIDYRALPEKENNHQPSPQADRRLGSPKLLWSNRLDSAQPGKTIGRLRRKPSCCGCRRELGRRRMQKSFWEACSLF